jgi:histidinol-phosphatase (PHP family)
MHTPLCKHAVGEPEEYVRRAQARGLDEIGFSDHNPMPGGYDVDFRMSEGELPGYVETIRAIQRKFPDYPVRLGLEADYHEGCEEFVRESTARFDFDYVIGSVHYLKDWPMDNPDHQARFEERDVLGIYREYFEKVERLAASGLYDILGHPDVVKKFGHRPSRSIDDLLGRAVDAVEKAGMSLDVNTSGLRRPAKEIYPSRRFLELAREAGVTVTLGSDAHRPEEVGEGFAEAVALLKSVGYDEIQRYRGREKEAVKL